MGNPRKWSAGMPDAAGPAPIKPPAQTRSNPGGNVNRYSEQGPIAPPNVPVAVPGDRSKGAKAAPKPRKRRM